MRRWLALSSVGILVACGTLSGGSSDATPEDGADGGSVPGKDGAAATDGGLLADGACAHFFCADFENAAPFGFDDSTKPLTDSDGGWFASTTYAVSGRGSLGTFVHPNESAYLTKELGSPTRRVTVDFRLRTELWQFTGSGKAHPITLHCQNGGDVAMVKINADSIQISTNQDKTAMARKGSTWQHLRLQVDLPDGGATIAELTAGAEDAGAETLSLGDTCTGPVDVTVGDDPAGNGGTYELYIDDVAIDVE